MYLFHMRATNEEQKKKELIFADAKHTHTHARKTRDDARWAAVQQRLAAAGSNGNKAGQNQNQNQILSDPGRTNESMRVLQRARAGGWRKAAK